MHQPPSLLAYDIDVEAVESTLRSYPEGLRLKAIDAILALAEKVRALAPSVDPDAAWVNRGREGRFNITFESSSATFKVHKLEFSEAPCPVGQGAFSVRRDGYQWFFRLRGTDRPLAFGPATKRLTALCVDVPERARAIDRADLINNFVLCSPPEGYDRARGASRCAATATATAGARTGVIHAKGLQHRGGLPKRSHLSAALFDTQRSPSLSDPATADECHPLAAVCAPGAAWRSLLRDRYSTHYRIDCFSDWSVSSNSISGPAVRSEGERVGECSLVS